jgi:alpha-D-xyloside xylohydrolase
MPPNVRYLNEPIDVGLEFRKPENVLFLAARAVEFDPARAEGRIEWQAHRWGHELSFNQPQFGLREAPYTDFPPVYPKTQVMPFSVSFVSPRTVRLRWRAAVEPRAEEPSLMLDGPVPSDEGWTHSDDGAAHVYTSACGVSLRVGTDPWEVSLRDGSGRLLTSTVCGAHGNSEAVPFSFVRRFRDMRRCSAAAFSLAPDDRLFGCGESFTRLNKRGQRLVLWPYDSWECQSDRMYKPIPFFLNSRGYGTFLHTSGPVTFDFGRDHDAVATLYTGDDEPDLFIFVGEPKEVLSEYTGLTGRSPTPPLWSFGLWMSRITYDSEEQVRTVAARLRQENVPCDVIHLDTGWFDVDWCCDYEFAPSRFDDPAKMIADLKEQGFRTCLWQLPYFTPPNRLFPELVEKGLVVRGPDGGLPTQDAILDFSNPDAVKWYQEKLAGLLRMGVGAIKVDFGEAAPADGVYASGRTGFYEHNLHPLRYNKAAAEVTKEVTGEHVVWARSAWAGSQRYPLHWGGDTKSSDCGMAAELRAGISFGLCGFSFWSHDVGGFTEVAQPDLYGRWLAFGVLTSHTRCHGQPPKEPWEFGEEFTDLFRRTVDLKYRLMPYVYAQARRCSETGLPMVRALFLEYPRDPGSWLVEDEYLFGHDLLVAPICEAGATGRNVYLPPGTWIDFQSGKPYEGARWHTVDAGGVPVVLMVRDGAALPMAKVAQHTGAMDWQNVELVVHSAESHEAACLFCLPQDEQLHELRVEQVDGEWRLARDPTGGRVNWSLRSVG